MSSSAITGPVLSDVRRAPAGTAAAPSFAFNDSTGTGVYLVSAGVLGLSTAGVQRVVVDASGNVGIGTASPSAPLQIVTSSNTINAAFGKPSFTTYQTDATLNLLGDHVDGSGPSICFNHLNVGNNVATNQGSRIIGYRNNASSDRSMGLRFLYANGTGVSTEGMRLDASGNLLVGTTSTGYTSSNSTYYTPTSAYWIHNHLTGTASGTRYHGFGLGINEVGSITQNGTTAVLYNTNSDYRLKENIQPIQNALQKVAALKPVTYTWKTAPEEIGEGFIAHELAEVCPLAVNGEKDAVNEDGSIKPQGIDPSKLVGLLTAAIQELSAKNDALEARLAALESK